MRIRLIVILSLFLFLGGCAFPLLTKEEVVEFSPDKIRGHLKQLTSPEMERAIRRAQNENPVH